MSWMRALLIFFSGLTAALIAAAILSQFFFSRSDPYGLFSDPIRLIFGQFETYIAIGLGVFAAELEQREANTPSLKNAKHSILSISLLVLGTFAGMGAVLSLLSFFRMPLEGGVSNTLMMSVTAIYLAEVGRYGLYALALIFFGGYLSRQPKLTQGHIEDTF